MSILRALPHLALLSLPCVAACAPQAGRAPRGPGSIVIEKTVFPSREALAKLAAKAAPAKLSDEGAKDVPSWQLTGPLPDAVDRAPMVDDSAWGKLLQEAIAPRGEEIVTTAAMQCVARENAAFYLANDALPAELLARFIAGRCGVASGLAGASVRMVTGDPRIPDSALFTQFRDPTRAMIDATLPKGRVEAGIAYVRKGGRAVIAVAGAPQTVRLDRTPIVPGPDGKVVLQGELFGPALSLRALVNRGRFGYAECAIDASVRLPRFRVTCETSREDEVAWLSIASLPPGRVLGDPLIEMLVWPSGAPGNKYAKLTQGGNDAKGSSPEALLAEINRVRQEGKLPTLRLADAESRTAAQLAPHYFGASTAGSPIADQVALGLIAGWEVEGTVRHGHFVSMWLGSAASWSDVVRAAIARPIGRETLLDPAAERVAIGPVSAPGALGAVFSTYALFDGYRHDDDARTVATHIGRLRAGRGLGPPRMVLEMNAEADRAARSVQAGKRTTTEALDDMLQKTVDKIGRGVRGWAAETTSLDRLPIPEQFVGIPGLTLGIGVAHHRREGEPWGRFLIYVVILDDGGSVSTARREGSGAG
jgi:hypothetical protein